MKSGLGICVLVSACLLAITGMQASGTYSGGGVKPPVKIDSARYELGKAVFTGKAKLGDTKADEEAQKTQLSAWQKSLPASVQKTADLPAFAGRLTEAQLDGLGHFLQIRYNVTPANR
jgi:hypothetical protein